MPKLEKLGHRPVALTLPVQGDVDTTATYADQVAAVTAAVDAADERPDKETRVALIGGMPNADGETYFGAFEPVDGVVPFPGWEPFEGPDSTTCQPS